MGVMLKVRCSQCHHQMNYQPTSFPLAANKRKQCVYCGKSLAVLKHLVRKRS